MSLPPGIHVCEMNLDHLRARRKVLDGKLMVSVRGRPLWSIPCARCEATIEFEGEVELALNTFTTIETYELQDRGTVHIVLLDREVKDLAEIRGPAVLDSQKVTVVGVEAFMHASPWRVGERIGLLPDGYVRVIHNASPEALSRIRIER